MSATITVYVVTKDIERMSAFYASGLGVKPAAQQGKWVPLNLGGATFALHAFGDQREEEVRRFNLGFGVDDVDAAVARFEGAGGKVLRGVADEAFGRMATLQDPDGRAFEVVQYS